MTEKRFWLVPIDYYGEPRFVKDKKLIGEKSMSNQEVVDLLNEQEKENEQLKKELESFEQVSFTDLCDGSRTVLYMKKENGDTDD